MGEVNMVNEELLKENLKKWGLRESLIKRIVKSTKELEKYFAKIDKTLDDATPDDIDSFLREYTQKYASPFHAEDLKPYYIITGNKDMEDAVEKMKYKYTPSFKLRNFQKIKEEYLKKLEEMGIKTNYQLLYACKTSADRERFAKKTGIPIETINEIAKLSDLSRIPAVKATRAQLYYGAGIDTVDKIANLKPEKLRNIVVKYVEENNLSELPTLPKEAEFTVGFAKKLHKIVEF